jgi:hypothetical protein
MSYTRNTGGNLSKIMKDRTSGSSSYTDLHYKKSNDTSNTNKSASRVGKVINKNIQIHKQKIRKMTNSKIMKL